MSWGYREDASFAERHGGQGTRDLSAYLAVPRAIAAWRGFDLSWMRALADDTELRELRLRPIPGDAAPFMRGFVLPPGDPNELWARPSDPTTTRPTSIARSPRSRLRGLHPRPPL